MSLSVTHFKHVCEHGIVIAQCRCPSPNKREITVPCPNALAHMTSAERDSPLTVEHHSGPEVGEYVFVLGKVTELNGPNISVEFFSKTDQYEAWVREDLIYKAPQDPDDICTALARGNNNTFIRCGKTSKHTPPHRTALGNEFTEDDVLGYFEEKS